jgi:hypothetical protein
MAFDWENPAVLGINRLPSRASGFSHATREAAFDEDPGAWSWSVKCASVRVCACAANAGSSHGALLLTDKGVWVDSDGLGRQEPRLLSEPVGRVAVLWRARPLRGTGIANAQRATHRCIR